jgi:hypothetical protein
VEEAARAAKAPGTLVGAPSGEANSAAGAAGRLLKPERQKTERVKICSFFFVYSEDNLLLFLK